MDHSSCLHKVWCGAYVGVLPTAIMCMMCICVSFVIFFVIEIMSDAASGNVTNETGAKGNGGGMCHCMYACSIVRINDNAVINTW